MKIDQIEIGLSIECHSDINSCLPFSWEVVDGEWLCWVLIIFYFLFKKNQYCQVHVVTWNRNKKCRV